MKFITFLIIIYLPWCGVKKQMEVAKKMEKKKEYIKALRVYKSIAKKSDEYAPEALYRAGRIYQMNLRVYDAAVSFFNEVIEKYPYSEFVSHAKLAIFNTPNYFPLIDGNKWVEGDSETAGKNMRIEHYIKEISTNIFECRSEFYAGVKLVSVKKRYFQKTNFELREYRTPYEKTYAVLLKFPFIEGNSWTTTQNGRTIKVSIEETNVNIRTDCGSFSDCIKLKIVDLAFPTAYRYEYYAPWVGKVLTTTASARAPKEHRVSELISYSVKYE